MEREDRLRRALVASLERAGVLHSPHVAAAMLAVPRHRFVPRATPDEAYADSAIALKQRGDEILSSISQPAMLAQMLELLAPKAGDRILEIGTGSGYNAALLCDLAGPSGIVTTVELDHDLAERARTTLRALGYASVRVVAGDGTVAPGGAPTYDRVIVSARSDDVAAAWWDALREGGRLVVPLRLEQAGEFAIGFERNGDTLRGVGAHPCAFIALRGEAAERRGRGDVFFRDPALRDRAALVRTIRSIEAVRATDATHEMLERADLVVARPVTIFGIRF